MNNVSLLIVFCNITIILCWTVDYFADDFDENANCKNEDKVKDLNKKGNCAKISRGEAVDIFKNVIIILTFNLHNKLKIK